LLTTTRVQDSVYVDVLVWKCLAVHWT